jgi:hypothetical protein
MSTTLWTMASSLLVAKAPLEAPAVLADQRAALLMLAVQLFQRWKQQVC